MSQAPTAPPQVGAVAVEPIKVDLGNFEHGFPEGFGPGRWGLLAYGMKLATGVLLDAREPRWDCAATTALLAPDVRVRGVAPGRYRNLLGEGEGSVADALQPADWLSPLPVAVLEPLGP